jgi:hypothetical protein
MSAPYIGANLFRESGTENSERITTLPPVGDGWLMLCLNQRSWYADGAGRRRPDRLAALV